MNETNNSSSSNGNIKYIFLLIGIVALVASYMLVTSKYTKINKDLTAEIETLDDRYKDLKNKVANEASVKAKTEENYKAAEEIYDKFDGKLSVQAAIMDTYNLKIDKKVDIPALNVTQPATAFEFANGNVGNSMSYTFSTTGDYQQMKDVLKYFGDYKGKRKVPTSVSFTYDEIGQKVTLNLNVSEYSIEGEGRKQIPVTVPEYAVGKENIFFSEILVN